MNEKIKSLMLKQQAITDKAEAENRDMTAEEMKEFNNLQVSIGVEESKERALTITKLCKKFGMDATEYIEKDMSVEQVKDAVLEKLQKDTDVTGNHIIRDEMDKFRAAAADGLRMRAMSGRQIKDAADGAQDFRGMSLKEMALECMERDGADVSKMRRMSGDDLFNEICSRDFFNPSASFPAILDTTIRKSIVQIYQETPTTFDMWTSAGSLPDFKENADHEYVFGGLSDFEKVPENGEIKADVPQTELLPQRKLDTYGKQFSMTRQAFINDDIGFLANVPGAYVAKAKDTIDTQVYKILFNNAATYDGVKLFEASKHKNTVATGAAPSVAAFKEMNLLMGTQTNQFGDAITVAPRFVLVGNQNRFDVDTILHSVQLPGTDYNDNNPFYGAAIQPIVVNKLDQFAGTGACPWYMIADPMMAKNIQVDYLNGNTTPTIRRMEVPGTLGYVWDVYFDWGVTVRDFRGMYMNPGKTA